MYVENVVRAAVSGGKRLGAPTLVFALIVDAELLDGAAGQGEWYGFGVMTMYVLTQRLPVGESSAAHRAFEEGRSHFGGRLAG